MELAKGTKDYLPEEMIVLNQIMSRLRTYFEQAGYNPITTPVLERMDVLASKFAGGEEILKETFQLEDQGKRKLGLRYDLTVPFARIISMNPQLKFPFKRYQMEKVYRDGPIGPGRYREFWQCDIDVVGSSFMTAEAELLAIAENFFLSYSFNPIININNRKIMNGILDTLNVQNKNPVILILDKFLKLSKKELVKELENIGYDTKESEKIIDTFADLENLDNSKKLIACEKIISTEEGTEGISEMKELLELCETYGLSKIQFSPMLARGLNYYTGTIFEVTLENNKITSSVCAGGRFDKMIGDFVESEKKYPAVGLSFGVSRIYDTLIADKKVETKKSVSQAYIISLKQDKATIQTANKLRKNNINAEVDLMNRSLRKNLDYANAMNIPFVILIGENEVKENKVTVRNLSTGDQQTVSIEEAIKLLQ